MFPMDCSIPFSLLYLTAEYEVEHTQCCLHSVDLLHICGVILIVQLRLVCEPHAHIYIN